MNNKLEHKLVNWVDGMEVSKDHQIQTENFFIETLCGNTAIHLTNYNYGLLPQMGKNDSLSDFALGDQVTNKAELRLRRCYAITAGGYRITYDPGEDGYMVCDISLDLDKDGIEQNSNRKWDIILSVNPYKRKPTGIPDPDENPPRHPDVEPTYQLLVAPSGDMQADQLGLYYLVIGKICYRGGRFEIDNAYIPPCTTMLSHPTLSRYYELFSEYIGTIEVASKNIISKVQNQQKTSTIAVNVNIVCQEIMRYISMIYFMHRNTGKLAEPIKIVNCYSSLAHICLSAFSFLNKIEKEELLQYFYNWNDVTPGAFEGLLSEAASILYDHNNIQESMSCIDRFLNVLAELWMILSRLEYIGQTKDNIVVSSRSMDQGKNVSSWSVID
jgi:hypothetical protein